MQQFYSKRGQGASLKSMTLTALAVAVLALFLASTSVHAAPAAIRMAQSASDNDDAPNIVVEIDNTIHGDAAAAMPSDIDAANSSASPSVNTNSNNNNSESQVTAEKSMSAAVVDWLMNPDSSTVNSLSGMVDWLVRGLAETREDLKSTRAALAFEISRATAAEAKLTPLWMTKSIKTATTDSILHEHTRATAAEKTLASNIKDLKMSIFETQAQGSALSELLSNEAQRAMEAEENARANLNVEEQRAQTVETELSSAIDLEVSRATDGEAVIAGNLENVKAHVSVVQTENQGVTELLQNEIHRAEAADADVNVRVEMEQIRAQQAEKSLSTSIINEISRATSAEGSLAGTLSALSICPPKAFGAPNCVCAPGTEGSLAWNGTMWTGACTGDIQLRSMASGRFHTCAVTSRGQIKCWGGNRYGQLGNGLSTSELLSTPPSSVIANINDAIQVATGFLYTCAVRATGDLLCWGDDTWGQLGLRKTRPSVPTPQLVASGVAQVDAGYGHTCAVFTNGDLKCWGMNNQGQLGFDGSHTSSVPTAAALSGIKQVSCGSSFTCALHHNGNVFCTGGSFLAENISAFALVGNVGAAGSISCGTKHCCAIVVDSTFSTSVKCWGDRTYGQLGDGVFSRQPVSFSASAFVLKLKDSGVSQLASGARHTCVTFVNGDVKCWGDNNEGELGIGNSPAQSLPTSTRIVNVKAVVAAQDSFSTCAILNEGGFKCWGQNDNGQLGIGSTSVLQLKTPSSLTYI